MTFREGLFSERGASLIAPIVAVVILMGAAFAFQNASTDANNYALTAQAATPPAPAAGATPAGGDKAECTAPSPSKQKEADGKTIKQVGKRCEPKASAGKTASPGDDDAKANCKATDGIPKGECYVKYCSPTDPKDCTYMRQGDETYAPYKTYDAYKQEKKEYSVTNPETFKTLTPDEKRVALALNPQDQDQIFRAYETEVKDTENQIKQQQKDITETEAAIKAAGECQRAAAPGVVCDDRSSLENDLKEQKARLVDLQTQKERLAADVVMLQPEAKPDCTEGKGCTAFPENPAQKAALEKQGYTCGTSSDGTACYKAPAAAQQQGPANQDNTFKGANQQNQGPGSGAGGSNPFSSMMQGLAKGLGLGQPQPQQAPAQQCPTDPQQYQQAQQQYQQDLQQYNYQMQQYNYQLQQQQYYAQQYGGQTQAPPPPPMQPTRCTPGNSNQCQMQVPQPSAAGCNVGSWQPVYNGMCVTNWRCVPNNGGGSTSTPDVEKPTAQISCQPQVADVGMQIAISYSCSMGTSTGSGFTTNGAQSGSATTTIANPPAGTNTATYSLTCNNQGKTAGAQCSVQIARPSIILVANPKTVPSGDSSLIGWITTGMRSCVVSSPDDEEFTDRNSYNTSVNGAATTSALTAGATYVLNCQTMAGGLKSATTSVSIGDGSGGGGSGKVTISSNAEGKTIKHGDKVTLTWSASSQPSGSRVALWLVDERTFATTALIAGNRALSGTYEWTVPALSSQCPTEGSNVCGADLVSGRQYSLEADVYTPANAYVGDGAKPSGAPDPEYGDYETTDPFTMGD